MDVSTTLLGSGSSFAPGDLGGVENFAWLVSFPPIRATPLLTCFPLRSVLSPKRPSERVSDPISTLSSKRKSAKNHAVRETRLSSHPHSFLQQLHRLDRSSHEFHDQLSNILYGEEYKQSAPNLDTDCSAWLVDYLDNVRRSISPPHLRLPNVGSRHSRSYYPRLPEMST